MIELIDFFKKINTEVFLCGGLVRDFYMDTKGKLDIIKMPKEYFEDKDLDICSSVRPDDLIKHCKKYNIKHFYTENGKNHGTISICLDENIYEHTSFRKDISTDGRNAVVEFSDSLEDDAKRRDFTMNSLYINLFNGEIIDPNKGIWDINNKIIRFVGNTKDRILEDSLRIMRFFRFSITKNFGYTNRDLELIRGLSFLLTRVSEERIIKEMEKMLFDKNIIISTTSKKFKDLLVCFDDERILKKFPICCVINTMFKCKFYHPHHIRNNVLDHSLDILNRTKHFLKSNNDKFYQDNKTQLYMMYCALFHDFLKPANISWNPEKNHHQFIKHDSLDYITNIIPLRVLENMKISTKLKNLIKYTIQFHMRYWSVDIQDKKSIFKFCLKMRDKGMTEEDFRIIYPVIVSEAKHSSSIVEQRKKSKIIIEEFFKINKIFKETSLSDFLSESQLKNKKYFTRFVIAKNTIVKMKYIYNKVINGRDVKSILKG